MSRAHEGPALLRRRACDPDAADLLAASGQLYAVVDAAGRPEVYADVAAFGDEVATSLYAGEAGALHAGVAPWLVRVDPVRCAWVEATVAADEAWGLYVVSRAGRDAVRRQLRRLLTVRLPEGELVRFRFYDPRVLPPFLSACTEAELDFVFGAVDAFATRDAFTGCLTVWERSARPVRLPRPRFVVPASADVVVPAAPSTEGGRPFIAGLVG